jgi:7-keto-8-aminopelargonate synthetase-like enzyme
MRALGIPFPFSDLARGMEHLWSQAVSSSYPVVPSGTARIRTQVSAAHSVADLGRRASRRR